MERSGPPPTGMIWHHWTELERRQADRSMNRLPFSIASLRSMRSSRKIDWDRTDRSAEWIWAFRFGMTGVCCDESVLQVSCSTTLKSGIDAYDNAAEALAMGC
eukprot:491544-Pelagomonas_calceolata.AAC.1